MLVWSLVIVSITTVCLLCYALLGIVAALLWLILSVLALLIYHQVQLKRLKNWLHAPQANTLPMAIGEWNDIFDQLHRLLRKQLKSKPTVPAALERFILAGEAMSEGLVVLDAQDKIEWCNPKAAQHLGLDRKQDCGQHITYLIRQYTFQRYLLQQDYSHPLILDNIRGGDTVLSIQLVPFGITRKMLLTRDISDIVRMQAIHRDFVANVSHELRTPLTVLMGFIETLLDNPMLDAHTRTQQLTIMHQQAVRIDRLVNDLLTLSQLENGTNVPQEAVDIKHLMQQIFSQAEYLSHGQHHISLSIASHDTLLANYDELYSAFSNLVSNAVRYTASGGNITLNWSSDNHGALFTVSDTGIGIEAEHLPRLTERFYRIDRGRSRTTGGTGLGLAIVKHIAQRHQAKLVISSYPGQGSQFSIHFPKHLTVEKQDCLSAP